MSLCRPVLALALLVILPLTGCSADAPGREAAAPAALSPADFAFINRLTWGASPADVAGFQRLGRQAWLDEQLRSADDVRLPDFIRPDYDAKGPGPVPIGQQIVGFEANRKAMVAHTLTPGPDGALPDFRGDVRVIRNNAADRMLIREIWSADQLREQMTWFWFNHFNTKMTANVIAGLSMEYVEQAIRPRVFGKFCDLVGATLKHPAMLIYLQNTLNTARKGNENYARELLELHTMGVDSGYTQADVQALARVLTGAGVDLNTWPPPPPPKDGERDGIYVFTPGNHDKGKKTLLGTVIKARGPEGINEATALLCRQPATARRVSDRIARYLVADDSPPALVDRMAEKFLQTDGDIAEVLRTMVASPEFEASLGTQFKDPNHYIISALRLAFPDRPLANMRAVASMMSRLGEERFGRISPDGYPLEASAWNASGQLNMRFDQAALIGRGWPTLFVVPDKPPASGQNSRSVGVVPAIQEAIMTNGLYPDLAPETRSVLAEAKSVSEWNALFLASPEFMRR